MKNKESVFVECIYAEQYRFVLKKVGADKALLDVDFSPIFQKQTKQFMPSYPSVLNDKRSHMPFFFVPGHENKLNENIYLHIHSTKIMQALQQKQQLYIPKPSIKNSCCIICKITFEDYLTHIETVQHQQAIKSSEFNKEIEQLCQKFSGKRQYEDRQFSKQKCLNKIKKKRIIEMPLPQLKLKGSETGSCITVDSWN